MYISEPENDLHHIAEHIKQDNNGLFPELDNNLEAIAKFHLYDTQNSRVTKDITDNWNNHKLPLGYRLVNCYFI